MHRTSRALGCSLGFDWLRREELKRVGWCHWHAIAEDIVSCNMQFLLDLSCVRLLPVVLDWHLHSAELSLA